MLDISFSLNATELANKITDAFVLATIALLLIWFIEMTIEVLPRLTKKTIRFTRDISYLMKLLKHTILRLGIYFVVAFYASMLFIKYQTHEINQRFVFILIANAGVLFTRMMFRWFKTKNYYKAMNLSATTFIALLLSTIYYSHPIFWISLGLAGACYVILSKQLSQDEIGIESIYTVQPISRRSVLAGTITQGVKNFPKKNEA